VHLGGAPAVRDFSGRVELQQSERSEKKMSLLGVFLAAMDAEQTQIEASFREAIRIAKEQKSIALEKRAETT
jgi:hypothetical protein